VDGWQELHSFLTVLAVDMPLDVVDLYEGEVVAPDRWTTIRDRLLAGS
jgi:hypothetical protein